MPFSFTKRRSRAPSGSGQGTGPPAPCVVMKVTLGVCSGSSCSWGNMACRFISVAQTADTMERTTLFEVSLVAVFQTDHLFPVPLIHIDGVQVIQIFVAADSVHIAVQALCPHGNRSPSGPCASHFASDCTTCASMPLSFLISKVTLRSTPFRSSFRPVDASRNSGADTRYRFSVAHKVSANRRLTVPMARCVSCQVQRGRIVCRDDGFAHNKIPLFYWIPALISQYRGHGFFEPENTCFIMAYFFLRK